MITPNKHTMTLSKNYNKTTSVFLNLILQVIILAITFLFLLSYFNYCVFGQIFIIFLIGILLIAINIYNTVNKSYLNLYDSILDILLELFDNPLNTNEGISIGIENIEPEEDPEGPEGSPEEEPEQEPEEDPEKDPEEEPEEEAEGNTEKKDKKRKRSEDSEDDSDENLPKKGKIDKGKGRADPNDISDDDYDKYGYRDTKNFEDEQSFYDYQDSDDYQNSDDDDNVYLAESIDRREELEKKLEGASPEEKKRLLNEIEVLTDLINNLLN